MTAKASGAWTVLIVDDSPDDRAEVRRMLLRGSERRFRFVEAETAAEARRALQRLQCEGAGLPLVVVLDYYLPDATAVELLADLSGSAAGMMPWPVVVLTGSTEHEIDDAVLRAGAQDFLGKDGLSSHALTRAIENVVGRHRLLGALRDSETRFRLMADQTPIVMWVTDVDGGIEFVNRAYCDFFGVSLEHVLGPNWQPLVHPDDGAYTEAFFDSLRTRKPFRAQARVRRADGEWRWIDSQGTPRFSVSGEFLGMIGVSPDVTEQRQANEDLREAARQKDEFIAVLAHELRSPLAPIRNAVHLLRLGGNVPVERMYDVLERQTNHMIRLVDELMEASRISRGKIELEHERLDVAVVLRGAVETSKPLIERARHRLTLTLPDEPLLVSGDSMRLGQVFTNLLNNAAKYTNDGGHIELSARRDGDEALIEVRDDGIGIAPEHLSRLFEIFAQVDSGAGRAREGLGIGLSLVQRLVELHGGSVQAASDGLGHGSRFTVRLPLAQTTHAVATSTQPARAPAVSTHRVLVVDDNRDAADSLGMLLGVLGAEVRVEQSGASALEALQSWPASVVLLDLGMPGMDGYEVARKIRSRAGLEPPTLIALTGWEQKQDREHARAAGFDHHLIKPVDIELLRTLLSSLERTA